MAESTVLAALLPPAAGAGGVAALCNRLTDPSERAALRQQAHRGGAGTGLWSDDAPEAVTLISHRDSTVVGRSLAEVAAGRDPFDTLCDLLLADPSAAIVLQLMAEADVRTIMADPLISVGSDNAPPAGLGHPRTWGCFPSFFGTYVREAGVVAWPEAIRKVSSATARQFGLRHRGTLEPGAIADVCVMHPDGVGHTGTYTRPAVEPTGIPYVVLAGEFVVEEGVFAGVRAGRVLRIGHPEPGP